MNTSQTIDLFIQYFKDAIKELRNNLGLYLVYIIILSLTTIIPNWMNIHYQNNNPAISTVAKLVFSIIPLLILSKIIYVIKVRSTGLGDYTKTFFSYLIYSILYLLLMLIAGILFTFPLYIYTQNNVSWILVLSVVGTILMVYFAIFYSLTPVIAAIEAGTAGSFFSKSKTLTQKNILLVIINQVIAILVFLITASLMLIKNPNTKLFITTLFSIVDAFLTIVLTLTAVKIYFYLNDQE